jgi:hypothetical protein
MLLEALVGLDFAALKQSSVGGNDRSSCIAISRKLSLIGSCARLSLTFHYLSLS